MSITGYHSTLTKSKIMRNHSKESMALLLLEIFELMCEIDEPEFGEMTYEQKIRKLRELQGRIPGG